jgi:hypothetical protein
VAKVAFSESVKEISIGRALRLSPFDKDHSLRSLFRRAFKYPCGFKLDKNRDQVENEGITMSEKPYQIDLQDRGEYIYVLVGGEKLSPEISAAYWNEIAEMCFDLGRNKILIEKEFRESVSAADMLQMSTYLGQLLPTRRIAFVDRFGHEDINELGKKLARNRDVMMQIFPNARDAEHWLLAN